MEVEAPANRVPAPYGQACTNCAKAKCKCILRHGGVCERCHRLSKECSRTGGNRRGGIRKPVSRRSQLEEKLDDLVSLLRDQQAQSSGEGQQPSPASDEQPSRECADLDLGAWYHKLASVTQGGRGILTPPITGSRTASNASPSMYAESHIYDLLPAEGQRTLDFFRSHHLKSFPFIYIPPDMTAMEVQKDYPMLWMILHATCTKSPTRQVELGVRYKEILARKVVVEGERSLDLLLSIMVYCSWAFFFARGRPYLGIVSNMARAMVADMRLYRPLGDNASSLLTCPKPYSFYEPPKRNPPTTNQERRVLLSLFILSSLISSSLAVRYDAMKWTAQLDEAVAKLTEQGDSPDDALLVAISRITKVSDEAAQLTKFGFEDPDHFGPPMYHVKALRQALADVKSMLPLDLLQNKVVISYLCAADVLIHETALFESGGDKTYDFRRIEYLHDCMRAARDCLENYVSMEPAQNVGTSMPLSLHCSHSLQTLFRLSTYEHAGWDRSVVRQNADLL
ncbi:hypothetical protein EJ04DRAFT_510641 [Polyplosphaeria fusca]|uniref:Zn(2)-C6 fungal-type domain-containing protein n=1 Tax=Polyplosphaeria fusca TaxID=682080 RepID=A0A9P4R1X1_9PLEO|nr:hypothetical protein EJ04DRAFT_510641 [Polyplosphaeria fusca]